MSRPLLLVFALLLVLRAWVGDAMAMSAPMAGHGQHVGSAATAAERHASHADGAAAHGGGMHDAAPAAAHGGPTDCGEAGAGPAACGDCPVCQTAALPFGATRLAPAAVPQALPRATPLAYASADPAPGFKPPIFRSSRP